MQNVQALVKVAEWLEDGAKHVEAGNGHKIIDFDMDVGVAPSRDCGTACCIAGAIVQFENLIQPVEQGECAPDFFDSYAHNDEGFQTDELEAKGIGTLAREHLGISEYQASKLFTPWDYFDFDDTSDFTRPKRAAAVLRHFIATGVVEWDMFDDEGNAVKDAE